jgi:hypothetical protein
MRRADVDHALRDPIGEDRQPLIQGGGEDIVAEVADRASGERRQKLRLDDVDARVDESGAPLPGLLLREARDTTACIDVDDSLAVRRFLLVWPRP